MKKRKTPSPAQQTPSAAHCGAGRDLETGGEIYRNLKTIGNSMSVTIYPRATYVAAHPGTQSADGRAADGGTCGTCGVSAPGYKPDRILGRPDDETRECLPLSLRNSFFRIESEGCPTLECASEYRCKELIRLCDEVSQENHHISA